VLLAALLLIFPVSHPKGPPLKCYNNAFYAGFSSAALAGLPAYLLCYFMPFTAKFRSAVLILLCIAISTSFLPGFLMQFLSVLMQNASLCVGFTLFV